MNTWVVIIIVVVSYLIGSISFARILGKLFAPKQDLTKISLPVGDGAETYQLSSVGATTASLVLGPKLGGAIGMLDILKGFVPTLIARLLFPDQLYFLFAGAAVVAGHIWPVFFGFKGGWGMSPILGSFFVLDPIGTLVTNLLALLLGLFVFKDFMVALMGGLILMIPWIWLRTGNGFFILYVVVVNLMIFLKLLPELLIYLKTQKDQPTDMHAVMDAVPMGQMMNKMMAKMGVQKKSEIPPTPPPDHI